MDNGSFVLVLDDGTRLFYDPHRSRLTDLSGGRVDLAPVAGIYRPDRTFPVVAPVSPWMPGRKRDLTRIKIQLGLGCNYACAYCGQAASRRTKRGRSKGDIDRMVNFVRGVWTRHLGDGSGMLVEFWGGEPLLYWRTLKPLAEALRLDFPSLPFLMVTNGSLLDGEKVDWLDRMGFRVALSHDGPGQSVRGPDPLEDAVTLAAIRELYDRLRPQCRIGFNCVLTMANPSLRAVLDHLRDKLDDPAVVLSTEGIALALDPASALLMPRTEADHRFLRRSLLAECKADEVIYQVFTIHQTLTDFFRALEDGRPSRALGQRCGMDSPETLAVDMAGTVLTCQNTAASGGHGIGHVDDLAGVRLTTATHWSHFATCQACPVVQLCKGACMYQSGSDRRATCDGQFTFYMAMLALAVWSVTGKDLVAIEGGRIRDAGTTRVVF